MRILVAVFIFGLSLGCVERGRPISAHEGRVDKSTAAPTSVKEIVNVLSDPLTVESSSTVDAALLQSLAKELLNRDVMNSADARGKISTERKLWRLNEELSKLLKSNMISPVQQQWLERYEFFLSEGCNARLNRCLHMDFFALSKNTAQVAELLAVRHVEDLKRYYNLLRVVYTLKGKVYDSSLANLMLRSAREYLEILASEDLLAANEFAHTLSTITQQVVARSEDGEMKVIVEKLDLLNLTSRKRLTNLGYDANVLTQILAKAGAISGGAATAEKGQEKIAEYFAQAQSLKSVQESLVKNHTSMLSQLGVQPIGEWDEPLLVLDQSYKGDLNIDQAKVLLVALKTSRQNLAKKIREVYLIRFLQALTESTTKARKYFFEENVAGDDLLTHALNSGSRVQPIWGTFNARIKNFQNLSLGALRVMGPDDELFQEIQSLFNGTQKNIKFISVFPQMMALTYHMAKRNAKLRIDWGWRTFELDSSVLIEKLFLGQYDAWFNYSTDSKALTFIEMLYAFDFALRTGVFELFNVDPDEFVAEISERLIRRSSAGIRKYKQLLEQRTQSLRFAQFEQMCNETDLKKIKLPMDLKNIGISPLLGALNSNIFSCVSYNESNPNSSLGLTVTPALEGLMMFDSRFSQAAEESRVDLGHVQRWLEGLVASYRGYLVRSKETNIDGRLARAQAAVEKLKKTRIDFFKFALSAYRRLDHCYMKAYRFDEMAKIEILKREEAYLRQVYKELTRVKKGEVLPQSLTSQYGFKNLPSGFTGANRFTTDGYVYYRIDFLIRAMLYLSQDLKLPDQTWPAIAPQMRVDYGKTLNADNQSVRDSDKIYLSYTENEDAFVAQGINAIISKAATKEFNSSYTSWYYIAPGRIATWGDRLHAATVLYRLSDSDVLKQVCIAPQVCNGEQSLISAEELIAKHEEMLDVVKIHDDERHFMQMAGLYFKYTPQTLGRNVIDYSVIREDILQRWGLYDLPAFLVTRPVLGVTHTLQESQRQADGQDERASKDASAEAAKHFGFEGLGRTYWNVRRQEVRKTFLIPISSEVDQSLDQSIGAFIRSEIERVDHFGQVLTSRIKEVATWSLEQRPRVDITLTDSFSEPLLNINMLRNFDRDRVKFEQRTDYCYSKPGCESFQSR